MKGIVVERAGGPEVLQVRTVPTPELRPGWISDPSESIWAKPFGDVHTTGTFS